MATLNQFAWQLGAHQRMTKAYSLIWHKAYVKAAPTTQAVWREEFIAHFLMGNLEVTEAKAKAIIGKSRPERTKAQQNAYRAAEMKFNYHIIRKSSSDTEPAAKPKKVRVSSTERSAYDRFLAAFGGDVARLKAVVEALA
jgi:hypothetical protein